MRRVPAEELQDRASKYSDARETLAREVLAMRRTDWDDLGNVGPEQKTAAHFRRY